MAISRRGFLSLCATLPVAASIPAQAEPVKLLIHNALYGKLGARSITRYSLGLVPDSLEAVAPGRVVLLRGIAPILFRPDRLILSNSSFSLLHLGSNGEPLLEDEIPSAYFMDYSQRLDMASLEPEEELILAAVNRSKEPEILRGALIGSGIIPEE